MDIKNTNENEQHEGVFSHTDIFDEILVLLTNLPKRQYTQQENDFVNETLNRKNELEQLRDYFGKREQKKEIIAMEKMLITAIQNLVPQEAIEAMRQSAGITEARLVELKKQAQVI